MSMAKLHASGQKRTGKHNTGPCNDGSRQGLIKEDDAPHDAHGWGQKRDRNGFSGPDFGEQFEINEVGQAST